MVVEEPGVETVQDDAVDGLGVRRVPALQGEAGQALVDVRPGGHKSK
jgi:hypothetical protein